MSINTTIDEKEKKEPLLKPTEEYKNQLHVMNDIAKKIQDVYK